jgi:hypothetical protein
MDIYCQQKFSISFYMIHCIAWVNSMQYFLQLIIITATQVYDQKSTKIERNTVYKLSSIRRGSYRYWEKSYPLSCFFAAEVPRFNLGAYWVVKPLKFVFCDLKGQGSLKNSKKFAEM